MQSLFPHETFAGFGPSRVLPADFQSLRAETQGRKAAKLWEGVRSQAPKLPGVYGMIDRRGRLIYVGKAKRLRCRLMSYFRVNSRDPKAGRILRQTHSILWETTPDEFGALIRELELIRRFCPKFNVQGQPGSRRYIYLCIGRSPAPYAFATRDPTGKELAMYGPLVGASRIRESARRLNDAFRLRDCPQRQAMRFADQRDLFSLSHAPGCIRYEIGTCHGPCASLCSQSQYGQSIDEVQKFLEGTDRSILDRLADEMVNASQRLEYERAMAVRDKLADLRWLVDRLVWLKTARQEHSFIYPLEGPDGRTVWYLIERGQVRAAVYQPKNVRARKKASALIGDIYSERKPTNMMPHHQVDSVLLVAAWFRKRPDERERCLTASDANATLVPNGHLQCGDIGTDARSDF